MKGIYIQRGESLDYTNTGDTPIQAGEVVSLVTRIGVAGCPIEKGGTGAVHVTGVFALPKKSGEALTLGAAVYWSAADGVTAAEGSGIPAGWVVRAAAAGDATAQIKLLG